MLVVLLTGCSSPAPDPRAPDIRFTNVTEESGLGDFVHYNGAYGDLLLPEIMGSGVAFADVDRDGYLDIVLVTGDTWPWRNEYRPPALRIFRNERDGSFAEVTERMGLSELNAYGQGVTIADYDGDDDVDIYLTTLNENILLRNDDGIFRDVAFESGVTGGDEWSASASFFDANRDGLLDLIVTNYVEWSREGDLFCSNDGVTKTYCSPFSYVGLQGRFYENNGDGTFTEATDAAGFDAMRGKGLGVHVIDYNRDGWPDVAIANDTEPDELYENRGDGTFRETGVLAGIAVDPAGNPRAGMGITSGVLDDTGRETLIVGNFALQMISVFRYEGNGIFSDRAVESQVGAKSLPTLTFGVALLDVELDGDLDLLAANGHIHPDAAKNEPGGAFRQPPQLFINDGGGRFSQFMPEAGSALADSMLARGVAVGDYDRDGDPDVLLAENGGPVRLLRNDARSAERKTNGYLHLTLQSRDGAVNPSGTLVRLRRGPHQQVRYTTTGSGYLSQSETAPLFGVEDNDAQIDTLAVHWPSGSVQYLTDVPVDGHYRLEEGRQLQPLRP